MSAEEKVSGGLSALRRAPVSGDEAAGLVVLLHGLGAAGHDLMALADNWGKSLPRAAFVAPHAPQACDMAPRGRQWFSLAEPSPHAVIGGVQDAAPPLTRFLDAVRQEHGLAWSQLALVGFSQGAMMALHVAPRLPEAVAGVVGYSGMLVQPSALAAEMRSRPPMLLVHGDSDPVVEPSGLDQAAQTLDSAGIDVTAIKRPGLGHGIDGEGLARGGAFLEWVLPAAAAR